MSFKQRKFKKRKLVEKPTTAVEDDQEDPSLDLLHGARLAKGSKVRGLNATVVSDKSGTQRQLDEAGTAEDGAMKFTAQHEEVRQRDSVQEQMELFVQQKMAEAKGGSGGEAAPAVPTRVLSEYERIAREEASLFDTPQELKELHKQSKLPLMRPAADASAEWASGLEEIALPVEHKIRNIERTEKLREQLSAKRAAGGTSDATRTGAVVDDYRAARFQQPSPGKARTGDANATSAATAGATDEQLELQMKKQMAESELNTEPQE